MTDQEIIATWMEPRPRRAGRSRDSIGGWWRYCGDPVEWQIPPMWKGGSLDALHDVEARLMEDQWWTYMSILNFADSDGPTYAYRQFIHASAAQKITALATVLRPIVEAA